MGSKSREFKPVQLRKETFEKIKFLAKKSNKSQSGLVTELIDAVFTIANTFDNINLDYEYNITNSTLLVTVSGRNKLITGSFEIPVNATDKEERKELRKRLTKK
jgi:hypothetical protein